MLNKSSNLLRRLSSFCLLLFLSVSLFRGQALNVEEIGYGSTVKREERSSLIETENGRISVAQVRAGTTRPYYLQFITLEPNSLLLPALLHAEMIFYVHTGSGRLSWADEDDMRSLNIRRGDVYRLQPGSVFYLESNLEQEREKLRIYAIFAHTEEETYEPWVGAYTSISDLILGFDKNVLQSAFKVSGDVIEELLNATRPAPMVHALPEKQKQKEKKKKDSLWELEARFLKASVGSSGVSEAMNRKNKKARAYNILDADPDFKNCNGWSLTVDWKDLRLLKDSNIGIFMVNLTKGSMMGPHWNPMSNEIAIVLHGQGMVRVVCPSTAKKSECKNMRLKVEEGDVFAVPRFHPMAQMSFDNDSFVFMGFSTTRRKNHPQFLAGKRSVLQALDRKILSASFNVSNTTIDQLLAQQAESIILDCTSCAEEEESIMQEEIRREWEEEEARKREEEEAMRRQEEEEARRREEEQKEQEEAKKREEEWERQEEEARRRQEEEEARRREEWKRQQEEAAKKQEEEEAARERWERQQEEKRRQEEEAQRQQEEARRRQEKEEARRRQEEEEAKRREEEQREQEETRKREEEWERQQKEARRRQEEEEARRREDEWKRQQEEAAKRQQEEEARERWERQQEEKRSQEEEAQRQQEEVRKREEEWERQQAAAKQQQEEEARERWERQQEARQQEEAKKRQEEEAQSEQEERQRGGGQEGEGPFGTEVVRAEMKKGGDGKRGVIKNLLKV